jgi:hypothetical protein
MTDFEWCPVCRRFISVSDQRVVMRHRDKAGARCPMSGNIYPRADFEIAS